MPDERRGMTSAIWLNLVLPGGGLIWVGATISGMLIGLAFSACANLALATLLLTPEACSPAARMLLVGVTGGAYVGAQWRLGRTIRHRREADEAAWRRETLWVVRSKLEEGLYGEALQAVDSLAQRFPEDLLVAYRLAQVLSAAGTVHAAKAAWERVRVLDAHGIYREQARAAVEKLDGDRLRARPP